MDVTLNSQMTHIYLTQRWYIDDLMQLELRQFCTNPLIWVYVVDILEKIYHDCYDKPWQWLASLYDSPVMIQHDNLSAWTMGRLNSNHGNSV